MYNIKNGTRGSVSKSYGLSLFIIVCSVNVMVIIHYWYVCCIFISEKKVRIWVVLLMNNVWLEMRQVKQIWVYCN